MDFKNGTVSKSFPVGTNIINHEIRVQLEITCNDYCILDTIIRRKTGGKDTDYLTLSLHTGFSTSEINESISNLEKINIIKESNNIYLVNRKMLSDLAKKERSRIEDEFYEFWTELIDDDKKRKVAWNGPKEGALKKFILARKKYSFDYIMKQRKDYFALLLQQTWRQRMIATKFLNIETGQLMEDFASQVKAKEVKVKEKERTTLEDKEKQFTS